LLKESNLKENNNINYKIINVFQKEIRRLSKKKREIEKVL